MKIKSILLISLFLGGIAHAETLKEGTPVCLTSDLYSQLTKAVANKDNAHRDMLLKNGCIILGRDLSAKVIELNFVQPSKVKVNINGEWIEVYTAREFVKD